MLRLDAGSQSSHPFDTVSSFKLAGNDTHQSEGARMAQMLHWVFWMCAFISPTGLTGTQICKPLRHTLCVSTHATCRYTLNLRTSCQVSEQSSVNLAPSYSPSDEEHVQYSKGHSRNIQRVGTMMPSIVSTDLIPNTSFKQHAEEIQADSVYKWAPRSCHLCWARSAELRAAPTPPLGGGRVWQNTAVRRKQIPSMRNVSTKTQREPSSNWKKYTDYCIRWCSPLSYEHSLLANITWFI